MTSRSRRPRQPERQGSNPPRRTTVRDQRRPRTPAGRKRERSLPILPIAVGAVVVALGIALVLYARITAPPPQPSTPLLASAQGGPGGSAVDGIQCQASEGAVQHVHAHLAVYVNGGERAIPASVGIPGNCLYWTHTHDQSGVIHVEAPNSRTFTLGNFFDVWGQPLSSRRVGPAQGTVTAYVDGRKYTDDPRTIPLSSHTEIQLDVGAPAPAPKPYAFPSGL